MAKVYISSTLADLKAERDAVMDWLVAAGHQPVHSYVPNSDTVRESCLDDVDGCDLYVLILGHRYGFQPADGNPEKLSITQLEFRRAILAGVPRIALIKTSVADIRLTDMRDSHKWALLLAFEDEVRRKLRPAEFSDPQGLIVGLSTGVPSELEKIQKRTRGAVVVSPNDPQVIAIVATLTAELDRKNRRIDELEEQLRAATVHTLTVAAQPGATGLEKAAAVALKAGDSVPAEALLKEQERRETAQIGQPGADDIRQRREAATLARQQGALAMGHDVSVALEAYQRASEYEPEDVWTHFSIGDLHVLLGDLEMAKDSFERAQAIVIPQTARHPADTQAERDLSVSYNRIGGVLAAQGDQPAALAAYRKALDIAEKLAARDTANTQWQRDLSVSHEKIGNMLAAQGDGPESLDAYRTSLEIRERLAARDPANTQWQRDLSVSHNKIGDMLTTQGDQPAALAAYRRSLDIAEKLAARDPANTEWQRDVSISHDRIGDMLTAQGDQPAALAAYRKSVTIREKLASRDPANAEWQRDVSISHDRIGDILAAQGDQPAALAAYRKSLDIAEKLAARDPANTEWQRDLSVSHDRIGNMLAAQGDQPAALAGYRKALDIAEKLAARDPANTQWQTDVAVSCSKLGTLTQILDTQQRCDYLQRGRAILLQLQSAGRLSPSQNWIAWFDEELAKLQ